MTSIDQALLGAPPVKQGHSGGKALEKSGDEKGSNRSDAFESVFADAGRNKDEAPVNRLDGSDRKEGSNKKNPFPDFRMPVRQEQPEGAARDLKTKQQADLPEDDAPADEPDKPVPSEKAMPRIDASALRHLDVKTVAKPVAIKDTPATEATAIETETAPAADIKQLMELLAAAQNQSPQAIDAEPVNAKPTNAGLLNAEPAKAVPAVLQEAPVRAGRTEQKKDTGTVTARFVDARDTGALPLTETPDSETDAIFRFAREDGKGRSIDLRMSASDGNVVDRDKTNTAKIENVTVLESRRYLGLAANSNSSVLTTAISSDPEWSSAMRSGSALPGTDAHSVTGKVVNTLKLQMHPIDLGSITAVLRLTGDQLNVDLRVETGEAYRQLSDDQKGILKALKAQGFAVDQINVVLVQSDLSTAASQASDGNAQQQFNQSAREGAGGGTQQGRGQQDDARQAAADDRGWNDEAVDESVVVGADRGRPEHVYL